MPTYQYACKQCDHQLEAVQSFTDASLTECPECTGPLRKLFGSVGVIFKGSGFYRNDSRNGAKTPSTTSSDAKASSDTSAAKSSSDTKASGTSAAKSGSAKSPAPAAKAS